METKWTPGPWPAKMTGDGKRIVIGDGLVEGPGGYEVAEVYSDDCDREEAWANAHLIAAAPDLYAALEPLEAVAIDRAVDAPEWRDRDTVSVLLSIEELRAIRAALAKARGEA